MWIYVLISAILGLFPGIAYILIVMETWMIFSIAHAHLVDNTGEIVFFCTASAVISAVLKSIAHMAHLMPIVGQIANSVVAMLFVAALYTIAGSHYEHLQLAGKHPDTIMSMPH